MTPYSRYQATRLLQTWKAAGVEAFDIGVFEHGQRPGDRGQVSNRYGWSLDQTSRSYGWLGSRNKAGCSIHARPGHDPEAHPWILVNDLDEASLAALDAIAPAGAVVETSPGRLQAWVRIDPAQPEPVRTAIARYLASQLGGDPAAVGSSQYGRLPGTTNRKFERELVNGYFPFAKLLRSDPEPRTSYAQLARSVGPIEEPPKARNADARARSAPGLATAFPGRSQPEQDFAVACRLVEQGQPDEAVKVAIRAVRKFVGKASREDYLERTVHAARERTGPRSRT